MFFLNPQHWKVQWKASLSCFQRARAALARAVTNEEHLNELWLAQSCFVGKWNFTLCWLVQHGMQIKTSLRHEHFFPIIMSLKRKRTVLSIEDKQSIILRLEKGEKGTNLPAEYGISKQQISDIRKNKE